MLSRVRLLLMHGVLLMQVEGSEASEPAKPSDISPLIALEQSSVDVSAADLAGKPAGSVQDVPAASSASPYSASLSEGILVAQCTVTQAWQGHACLPVMGPLH